MGPFFRALGQPEYVHTLLNPLPIYGLTVALLALPVQSFGGLPFVAVFGQTKMSGLRVSIHTGYAFVAASRPE